MRISVPASHFRPHIYHIFLILVLLATGCQTQNSEGRQPEALDQPPTAHALPKVALLGVFHFGGSSGDLASMEMSDPFGERRQAEIKELVDLLSAYRPTKILVEYPKERQSRLQERFERFLSGKDTLGVNEIDQLGFRLAQKSGHTQLFAIDYKQDLPADGLVEYCQRNNKMHEFEAFVAGIQEYVADQNKRLDTMQLSNYLAMTNTDSVDRLTNDLYVGHVLSWGDSIQEAGARFASTWWERNFVILDHIAGTISDTDERVLVIIGSGHRAVLKNLVIDRRDMDYVEIGRYLNSK